MGVIGVLTTLAISTVLVAYVFYALVPVPAELEHRDDLYWEFAKRKYTRGISIVGEFFGLGHRTELYRRLSSSGILSRHKPVDYTGIMVNSTEFAGVPVRIIEPVSKVTNGPAVVWIHGGGWVFGSAESDDDLTTELARRLGIVIVSIDYRLAPEFPFPIPFDDCVRAFVYFMEHAEELNVDNTRIAIAGASAGANLAAAVAMKLRDIGNYRRPSVQVLVVPCLQAFDFSTYSYQRDANNALLPSYWMASFWLWYARGYDGHQLTDALLENGHTSSAIKASDVSHRVGHNLVPQKYVDASYVPDVVSHGDDALWAELESVFLDPYFAPLMAADLHHLPPAYIATAERDVLRDDGIMYAKRLASAGVSVEHQHYAHSHHALYMGFKQYKTAETALNNLVTFLSRRL